MTIIQKLKQAKNDKNTRTVLVNMFFTFLIKGGSLFIALFTTPAYISYFSNDAVLGVWFTILTVLAWLLTFDMGVGNGVRNRLVETLGKNDMQESKKIVSSAYLFLIGLSFIIIAIILILSFCSHIFPILRIDWNDLLGISTNQLSKSTLETAVLIVFISIIVQFVLRLITSISYAIQNSFVANLLHLCTNVFLLIYVLIANHTGHNGNIITLAIVYFFAVNIPLLAVTFFLFLTKLRQIRPSIRYFDLSCAKSVLKLGVGFLYLQFAAMLLDNTASFLISTLTGADQVVEYQLYYKLFSMVGMIIAIAIVPMWSAITKAYVEKQYNWLKKSVWILFAVVGLSFLAELLIVLFLPFLFDLWLGKGARTASRMIGLVFALYGTCHTWKQVCSYIQNGLGQIKLQAVSLTLGVIISFVCSYAFSKIWDNYLAVVFGMVVGHLPACIVQTFWVFRFTRKLGQTPEQST